MALPFASGQRIEALAHEAIEPGDPEESLRAGLGRLALAASSVRAGVKGPW